MFEQVAHGKADFRAGIRIPAHELCLRRHEIVDALERSDIVPAVPAHGERAEVDAAGVVRLVRSADHEADDPLPAKAKGLVHDVHLGAEPIRTVALAEFTVGAREDAKRLLAVDDAHGERPSTDMDAAILACARAR